MEGISLSSHGLNSDGTRTYVARKNERFIRCGTYARGTMYHYVFFAADDFDAYVHVIRYLKEHPDE